MFKRIQQDGLKIREEKHKSGVSAVEYLGFCTDGSGIYKTQERIMDITKAKTLQKVKESQSFLG